MKRKGRIGLNTTDRDRVKFSTRPLSEPACHRKQRPLPGDGLGRHEQCVEPVVDEPMSLQTNVRAALRSFPSQRKRRRFVVHFLPPLAKGKQYQLWAIADQRPLPAGVFDVDSIGHNALTVQVNAADPDLFAITVEPRGGLPAPSGPIVIKRARL